MCSSSMISMGATILHYNPVFRAVKWKIPFMQAAIAGTWQGTFRFDLSNEWKGGKKCVVGVHFLLDSF